ncbi:shikimate kinase [Halobacillus yeomjeoni]|uniref:shikimate kinase n=1 Tax=Halobacillus yeomjeoni TaxID=311194 RepID=UPI001CD5996A|nr:shikimate kinase [Halobacillus yeomjeoni]MCA0982767.1 shikimate kinase [Halobacillus yeomjeoni]
MIYLIGFMGCGKSTVGKLLSERMNIVYMDMDETIEENEKKSIPEIFKIHGENYFRELETNLLLNIDSNMVVSTGGGVILSEKNRQILSEGTVIYLKASWETINERLSLDTTRPLWKGDYSEKKERFEGRLSMYESIADHIIQVDHHTPSEVADDIIACLK